MANSDWVDVPKKNVSNDQWVDVPKTIDAGFLDVANERNKDISGWDRFKVKNLGGSLEDQKSYLQQKYPQLDVQIDNNEIVAKRPEEATYTKLDPSSFELADISDIAYDVGSGLVSGAATTAGLAGGGIGAVGAGAASSAGLEYLRQKLGQAAGTHGKTSAGDIALSGALGAAAPVLFGAGKAGSTQLKGWIPKVYDSAKKSLGYLNDKAPKIIGKVTGLSEEAIQGYKEGGEELIKKLDEPKEITAFVNSLKNDVADKIDEVAKGYDEQLETILPSNETRLDAIKNGLKKEIELGYKNAISEGEKQDVAELAKAYENIFVNKVKRAPLNLKSSFDEQKNILQTLKRVKPTNVTEEMAKLEKEGMAREQIAILKNRLKESNKINLVEVPDVVSSDVAENRILKQINKYTTPEENAAPHPDYVVRKLKNVANQITEQRSPEVSALKDQYHNLLKLKESWTGKFIDTGKQGEYSDKTLKNLLKETDFAKAGTKQTMDEIFQVTGINVGQKARQLKAAEVFGPLGKKTRKSISQVPLAYLGAGIGGLIGRKMPVVGGSAGTVLGMTGGAALGYGLASPFMVGKYLTTTSKLGKNIIQPSAKNAGKLFNMLQQKFPNASPQVLMNLMNNPQNSGSAYDGLGE